MDALSDRGTTRQASCTSAQEHSGLVGQRSRDATGPEPPGADVLCQGAGSSSEGAETSPYHRGDLRGFLSDLCPVLQSSPTRRLWLLAAPLFHELALEVVKFGEPLPDICHLRFEEYS